MESDEYSTDDGKRKRSPEDTKSKMFARSKKTPRTPEKKKKNDMTRNEIEVQRKIRRIAQEEKKKGKQVEMGFLKIIIDKKQFRWNNNKEDIEEILPKN
ncbi:hypothetical protein ILUMI_07313 [Ignelater luminosus]|uniref:Uncharacterized protein n=1 Tax=Ignelater luminosus TaxID=2038154 RepID=A0A8K0DDR4_IGNLU|nr:hypothetical protein ILUMI_07313 [Ignelater luminosus]